MPKASIPERRNLDELSNALTLLYCEFESLSQQYALHINLQNEYVLQKSPQVRLALQKEINDCLTLFCVRARNLANFFLKDCKKRADDIKIEDFGLTYSIFDELSTDGFSKNIVDRISKEISHLTYQSTKNYKHRIWNTAIIYEHIKNRFQLFAKKISKEIDEKSLKISESL